MPSNKLKVGFDTYDAEVRIWTPDQVDDNRFIALTIENNEATEPERATVALNKAEVQNLIVMLMQVHRSMIVEDYT